MVAQPFISRQTTDWWPVDATAPRAAPPRLDFTNITNVDYYQPLTIGFSDGNRPLKSPPIAANRHEQRRMNALSGRKPKPSRRRHKFDK